MTLPFATYVAVFFTNLPISFITGVSEFLAPVLVAEKMLVVSGLIVLGLSAVHLWMQRGRGLITSGPYRFIRHPQYFGIVLSTIGLTSWSFYLLTHTRGIGFMTASQTTYVWGAELVAYVFLACVEELFLAKKHGATYETYRSQVPFLVPLLNTRRKVLDMLVAIVLPSLVLVLLINFHPVP
jgi:protein-S-isoprenylcysteine O-methyltransferase Ste14